MLASVAFDTSSVNSGLDALDDLLRKKLLKEAAAYSGKVLVTAYRNAVPVAPSGTYKSAAGAIERFTQLQNAIGQRTLQTKDRSGAYSVVGVVAAPGSWRPLTPQGMWLEWGTDDRWHKSDGQFTGHVTPQHILESVVQQFAQVAQDTFIWRIKLGLAAYNAPSS